MDEMKEYEIQSIIENLEYLDRNSWEQTRLSIYSNAQMNTRKHLTVTDIMTFPWEKEKEKGDTEISTEDINRLREMAKKYTTTE